MKLNNAITKKNLNTFITLTMHEGREQGLNRGQLNDLYQNAVNVFFFNDLEKAPEISKQVVNYFWCVLNPLYYQSTGE